jgi:hypothetical protein
LLFNLFIDLVNNLAGFLNLPCLSWIILAIFGQLFQNMVMFINFPMLPHDVVGHIRAYVYGPDMLAFRARYGERIPARVLRSCNNYRIVAYSARPWDNWSVGLRRRYTRFLWYMPRCAFRYLTKGMPVIVRLGDDDTTLYTFIEMRHSSVLIRVGPCEIEMPTCLIAEIVLYVDVPDALTHYVRPCYPGVTAAIEEANDLACAEQAAGGREWDVQWHSMWRCAEDDYVHDALHAHDIRVHRQYSFLQRAQHLVSLGIEPDKWFNDDASYEY